MKEKTEFGVRIEALSKSERMNFKEIAKEIGVSYRTMQNVIGIQSNVKSDFAIKLCTRFGVSYRWFFTGEGVMYSKPESKLEEKLDIYEFNNEQDLKINKRKMRLNAFIEHWFETQDSDEQAWLEGQLKRSIPEYNDFIFENDAE